MGLAIGFSHALCFILVKLIVFNGVEGKHLEPLNNTTTYTLPLRSDRVKRAPDGVIPHTLKMTIKHSTDEELKMTWSLVLPQFLANEYLPVVLPLVDTDPLFMENLGEFRMYQNHRFCSALVYFKKWNTLYGVIGMNYYIEALPFNFDERGKYRLGVVGEPFVRKYKYPIPHIFPDAVLPPPSDLDAWQDYTRPFIQEPPIGNKRKPDCHQGPSAKHSRTEQHGDVHTVEVGTNTDLDIPISYQSYFSETLVLVTRDMAELFKQHYGIDHYLQWIVIYYIINFNTVDMIFQKLLHKKFEFHINIARIVIEDELIPFSFMNDDELQFTQIVAKLPNYLEQIPSDYAPDSFDHVFIFTSRSIFDDDFQVNARTKNGGNLYEARKNDQFYTEVPVTAMTYQNFWTDYIIMVHEIARTLDMKVDRKELGSTSTGQCYGIMQRDGPKCMKCLTWSAESQHQYNKYFYGNRNRCFLMNVPRSVRPVGISRYTSANRQCQCFGYLSSVVRRHVGNYGCNIPIECTTSTGVGKFHVENTVRPFDGTTCANRKVCWKGECEWLPTDTD